MLEFMMAFAGIWFRSTVVGAFVLGLVVGGVAMTVRNVKVNEKAQCARFFKADRTASDSLSTVKLGCELVAAAEREVTP